MPPTLGPQSARQKQCVRTYAGQKKAPSPIKETRWKRRLQEFKENPHEVRIVLNDEKYIKEDDAIAAMAKMVQAHGLYCQAYAKGMVIMKEPMPNFSTVFDRKPKQRKVGMSIHTAKHIHDIVSKAQDKRKERLATLVGSSHREGSRGTLQGGDVAENVNNRKGTETSNFGNGKFGMVTGEEASENGSRGAVEGESELQNGGGRSEADLSSQSRAEQTGAGAEVNAVLNSSMSVSNGARPIAEHPPTEPLADSMPGSGLVSESSLDLSEKLRRLAAPDNEPGAGSARSTMEEFASTYSGERAETISGEGFDGEWRKDWERLLEGEGSEGEESEGEGSEEAFTAEDKSDLELLDVLTANRRMKVNARVEGVSPGEALDGRSRRVRRNAALQELAKSVERKGAFSDGENSDDDFVDKSRWKKVEGGPHDGVKNAARKSVRRALREAERNVGGGSSVSGTPEREASSSTGLGSLGSATVSSGTNYGSPPVTAGQEPLVEGSMNYIGRDLSRSGGSTANGLVASNSNTGASSAGHSDTDLPFASEQRSALFSGHERAASGNSAGPSSRYGTTKEHLDASSRSGARESMGVDSVEDWKQRDVNGWSKESHPVNENGRGTAELRAAPPIIEADDYLSSSVGLEDREMEFRATRRGRRGVEPMPFVRERTHRELNRAEIMLDGRKRLPAWNVRGDLLRAVVNNQVVIVSGETGCGKTTQLPQFVLEEADASMMQCNIICTQPRRISAVSVATRVANERGEQVGDTVGYAVRLDQRRSAYTRLLYCTTGVLLRMMISDPALTHVTHIMVDEIHERGRDEDFLLIVLRDILPKRPDLRLVLMSATLNARLFSHYFGDAPVMHIPGFTHPVESLYLEDVLQLTGYTLVKRENDKRNHWRYQLYNPHKPLELKPEMFPDYPRHVQQSIARFNDDETLGPDLALVEALICHICCGKGAGKSPRVLTARDRHLGPMRPYKDMAPEGAVLVFLTGWEDIQDLMDALRKNPRLSRLEAQGKVQIMALHGQMPGASQKLIFDRPPPGVRKIVLATNLAETSVTIDDVVHVIDCGLAKEHRYDPLNKLSSLDTTWISKASARQRRGRAGRVQPGICYHLYPQLMYNKKMADYAAPEMLRTPLEELCLQVKSLEPIMGPTSIESILSRAMEPPDKRTIAIGVKMLQSIGAVDREENLTPLGKHLSELPIDPRLGKMLLMGATFQCLGPILTIAAGLSHKDPFSVPGTHKWAALEAKLALAGNTESDHVALVRAFEGWTRARARGMELDFCKEYFLSNATMNQIDILRRQYARILTDMGFVDRQTGWEAYNEYAADTYLVRAVLCSGLYPQIVAVNRDKAYGRVTYTFKDMDAADVDIHPMSVNHRRNEYKMPWMVFSNKIKTAKIYVRDSTPVCDLSLVVFGGHIDSEEGSGLLKMFDGYVMFTSDRLTATLIKGLRNELQALLQAKLVNPRLDIRTEGLEIIEGVRDLLQSSVSKGGFGHDMI
ncbi:probable ATP-dependent RNA helicase dhx36-like [Klebsormidium nitens]|uniref:RNA helicase n=1 Tax=Klebsormidium nitens TaxID=105231 RepID=A0A1Y1HQ68_KLENI|nr:probable ATP-dependent RNA helicase dhx36-like [Klebsormidium nitens]|eukprot:GAQ78707.1 probable ATP-dependent RNA helicase dhx36-like [Klebsormidium nitens]